MRLQWADEHKTKVKSGAANPSQHGAVQPAPDRAASLAPGADPPLQEQILPRCFGEARRVAALQRHAMAAGGLVRGDGSGDGSVTPDDVLAHYASHPRVERRVSGQPVDPSLLQPLYQVRMAAFFCVVLSFVMLRCANR